MCTIELLTLESILHYAYRYKKVPKEDLLFLFQDNNGNHAEIQQMIDMMKNYKNRLFLANHGKRSVIEPSEG